MQPSFITLMEAAELIGRPGNKGRTWLTRHIKERQDETGRVIIHGRQTKRVNVGELRQLCPELFPVEYRRAAAELRAELERHLRAEADLQAQLEQAAEAAYSLHEDVLDRIDQLRSAAITPRAMDEGSKVSSSSISETTNLNELAHHGPTQNTYDTAEDNAAWR
jgi:hypothetical protein